MALVNEAKKEINAKIVYLGAKGAGKSTALRFIYSNLRPDCRSELKCMASGEHQMLFFDFSYPSHRRNDGYTLRFHVYTLIPGGDSPPPWKMLLKGADGVVFLADSSKERMYANLEACTILYDAINHHGLKVEDLVLSLQCNKRDLDNALPLDAIKNELLPDNTVKALPVSALTGEGLLQGLNAVIREIMQKRGEEIAAIDLAMDESTPSAVVEEETEAVISTSIQHCEGSEFEIETAGTPLPVGSNAVIIPLRLKGSGCGKSVEFKIKVSVSL